MNNNNLNLFHGYIVKLQREGYMATLYHAADVLLIKKDDKYYILTDATFDTIKPGLTEIKSLEEGYYFTDIEPYDKYLKKKTSNQRKRKK